MNWGNEKAEFGTNKVAGEVQLRKYGKFLEEYAHKVESIEATLDCSINDAWDMSLDPSTLQSSPFEHATIVQLLDTDNKILNKVLIALAACCAEIRFLQSEAKSKYYNAILFYAEGGVEQDAAVSVSRMLSTLQNLACFVNHCQRVLQVVLQQLSTINSSPKSNMTLITALDVHFHVVIEHIGDLLLILVTLDELIHTQSTLQDHWSVFKRTLKSTCMSVTGSTRDRVLRLEHSVSELQVRVLSGNMVKQSLEQLLDARKGPPPSPGLAEQLAKYIRTCTTELDAKLDPQIPWTRLCVIFVLLSSVCGNTDKKLFKLIWEHHRKIVGVTLVGNVMWHPEDFLLKHLPHLSQVLDKKLKYYMNANRQYYLNQKCQSLPKEAQTYYFQVCSWLVQMDTCMKQDSTHLKMENLQTRCALFLQGLEYAITISGIVKNVTNLHLSLAKPMTRTSVLALCRLVELLKCIQYMYHTQALAIAESLNHVIQHLTYQALAIVANAKKSVAADKRYSAAQLDVLCSLLLVERALHGAGTKERRLVAHLALATASQMKTFREEELAMLKHLLAKLDAVCELQPRLGMICDCSFIYWHRVILPTYFAHLYENRTNLHRVTYMFAALRDCVFAMKSTRHTQSPQVLVRALQKETYECFKSQVLQPLCHEIETDLRLHVHSHLQLDERNPLRGETNNCAALLQTHPLRFFDQYIYVKAYVESYLNQTFYNLTTVALHDWKTYGEMRCLAKQKYDLDTVEDNLPSQTLEQGLDVLEIMRNIHVFVSKYLYNLNNQIFIENSSNNKHLNTINIRHIANSIRTHGTGIMNTTVNFTYQFLKKKFFILSQFLYDEQIKSRLIKDLRYFRDNKLESDQKYCYERADKFNRGIRKLGLSPEKLTYLDQFRILISHIGNAMGYVRMIRSGGIHYCSNAICFIPDLEDIVTFEELSQEQGLSDTCNKSARELDQVISTLTRNFDEGTEYFKLLVDVFAPVCKDPKNIHLRNFHAIVPPLTINFVEHSITSKDKMTKKNKVGAAFTDDGFAMGVAYILKLLELDNEFDSLHWFQSVRDKYKREKSQLMEQKTHASKDDEKLQQTMTLTARRLDMYQQEFELLYYSLSSARIFFQKHAAPLDNKDKPKE